MWKCFHGNNPSGQILKCVTGILLSLIIPTASFAQVHSHKKAPTRDTPARLAFERFKKLEGRWTGQSTKGWTEAITYKTIAGGSVVVSTSFDAHPNETMITMIHLDGERLMLTHYCVARNQPRLAATAFSDDGKMITFTFLDGTNMPSRNRGHMDKAVFNFLDEKHVTTRWSWYQDGKESWMEEITLEREPVNQ